jgi:sulfotransferase family protein
MTQRPQEPWAQYQRRRLWRHHYWLRTQGLARLIEEDDLNPLRRAGRAVATWRWRRVHQARPGNGTAVFVVGLQRSGTNMLVRGLDRDPRFQVYNENHRAAFSRFQLHPDPVIRQLVERSRHPYVLFKPLCDSHRTADLLDSLGLRRPPRAIWAYRSVDGRARSAVAKFGDTNLRLLRELAAGDGRDRWEARRLSSDSLRLISSFDWTRRSPLDAAALFWYVRNRLYFELGLAERSDVLLVSYDAMLADPEAEMGRICGFLDLPFDGRLVAHVLGRGDGADARLELHPRIREHCDELTERLDAARRTVPARSADGEVGR